MAQQQGEHSSRGSIKIKFFLLQLLLQERQRGQREIGVRLCLVPRQKQCLKLMQIIIILQ